jgi:ferric-dicitrate binding protein FerR (iron transport regulator)
VAADARLVRQVDEALDIEGLLVAFHGADPDIDRVLSELHRRIGPPRVVFSRVLRPMAVAASIALACALALLARAAWHSRSTRALPVWEMPPDSEFTAVDDGHELRTAVDSRGLFALADGSRMELAPGSLAFVRGPVGRVRQVVELQKGKVRCRVQAGPDRFMVSTAVGVVCVVGTEFAVELRHGGKKKGGDDMKRGAVLAMAVAVTVGSVDVQVGGKSYLLSAGQSRLFAEEGGGRGTKPSRVAGEVESFVNGTLTLKQRGDGGDGTQTVSIPSGATIRIETDQTEEVTGGEGGKTKRRTVLAAGSTADLVAGKRVSVTVTDGAVTEVVVHRAAAKKEGGRPRCGIKPPKVRREGGEGEGGGGEVKQHKPRREGGEGERGAGEAKPPKVHREGGGDRKAAGGGKPAGEG